jgi:D-alanyl-D-alanine carboxypeptidase (penicillin-binding protein 5/6)
VAKAGQVVGRAPVLEGVEETVPVTVRQNFNVTMQVDSHARMKLQMKYNPGLKAPIAAGQKVGILTVTAPDFPALSVPVYAAQPVEHVGFIRGLWQAAKRKFWPK